MQNGKNLYEVKKMSWAAKLQESEMKQEQNITELEIEEKKEPMHYLFANIEKIQKYCQDCRQDWVFFITGTEGSGKSTLASHVCQKLDPDFNLDESMIYSFRDDAHSFLKFFDTYKDVPFKVAWYDEAVTVLFSQRHSSKDSADAQELFKIKRDCRHFDILVSPSFWDVVPDIRERRTKSLLYCFTEVYHPTQNRTVYKHKYAYFSGAKIIRLSENKKAKLAFRSYKELFKIVKPDFVEEFPEMETDFSIEYLAAKRANRNAVLARIQKGGKKQFPFNQEEEE